MIRAEAAIATGMMPTERARIRQRAEHRARLGLETLLVAIETGRPVPEASEVERHLAARAAAGDRAARERLAELVLSECLVAERRKQITQSVGRVLGAAFGLLAAFAALA